METAINIIKSMKLNKTLEIILCDIIRIYEDIPDIDERIVCWYRIIERVSNVIFKGSSFLLDPEEGEITNLLYKIKEDYCI